jgi:hypothetical protein
MMMMMTSMIKKRRREELPNFDKKKGNDDVAPSPHSGSGIIGPIYRRSSSVTSSSLVFPTLFQLFSFSALKTSDPAAVFLFKVQKTSPRMALSPAITAVEFGLIPTTYKSRRIFCHRTLVSTLIFFQTTI